MWQKLQTKLTPRLSHSSKWRAIPSDKLVAPTEDITEITIFQGRRG